jgi:hypothetical protein
VITYLTAPAIMALLIDRPESTRVEDLWERSDRVAAIVLAEAQARDMVARAFRQGLIAPRQLPICLGSLQELVTQVDLVAVDVELVHAAAELIGTHALGWNQALDLAAAQCLAAYEVVLVAGDASVLEVASKLGLATAPLG